MKCKKCSAEESIPFRCNYCGDFFCHLHRIPMYHSCPFINDFAEKRRLMIQRTKYGNGAQRSFSNSVGRSVSRAIRIKSSKTELLHLGVATILIVGVGLSLNHYRHVSWQILVIFVSAFLVHELAHKFLAQYYGSWAEFRAQLYGLIITAISALPIMPFKFIAPGAVMVGLSDKNRFGMVALIGPLTNLIMGFSFLILTHLYPYQSYLYAGASFNAWIAMFNMLPFGMLDGQKIFDWNKILWACTMACAMILFIIAYI